MSGWRRRVYITILLGYLLTGLVLVLIADLALMAKVPLKDLLYLSISSIGIGWTLWITFYPLFAVSDWKVVAEPSGCKRIASRGTVCWNGDIHRDALKKSLERFAIPADAQSVMQP